MKDNKPNVFKHELELDDHNNSLSIMSAIHITVQVIDEYAVDLLGASTFTFTSLHSSTYK